jgi:hypothetical protein
MMLWRIELLQRLQELAGDGLDLLGPEGNPQPLQEVRDMYAFLERELPKLFDRWEVERPTGNPSARTEASQPTASEVAR